MFFVNIFRNIRSIAVIFFSTCLKINGTPFGVKMDDSSILWGLFLSPKVSTSVFRRADAVTGVSWRPPPRTSWLGQCCAGRALGGEAAERMGGGGARPRSRIAGCGGRAGLLPAATGRVADSAGPMKTTGHVKTESTEAVVHLWA